MINYYKWGLEREYNFRIKICNLFDLNSVSIMKKYKRKLMRSPLMIKNRNRIKIEQKY